MIKTLIIDDEPLAIAVIKDYLQNHPEINVVGECNNGFDGFKAILQYKPDLVFLDVQMPKLTGFEMLELVEDPPAIIFTTAFDEYAIKAFEANALDYLLKPFTQERFDKAINKLAEILPAKAGNDIVSKIAGHFSSGEQQRIAVSSGSNIRIIPAPDIYCVEAYDDYVKIHTGNDTFLKKQTLTRIENSLPTSHFLRVHRSFILQLQQITRIEPSGKESHTAVLRNGFKAPLSKSGYSKLREILKI